MPQPKIDPPELIKSDAIEQLKGSGFFGKAARTVSRGARNAAHSVAHSVGDRDNRHNAGAVLAAASPAFGPYTPAAAATGAALMASGKGKRAARTAKNIAKQATSRNVTRKAADIAGILANAFGSEETKRNVATAQQLERALQGEGLRLAGTGVPGRGGAGIKPAISKSKLMQAAKNALAPRKR